mgnify:FL=1
MLFLTILSNVFMLIDTYELLRCYATLAILKTFGFADFP